MKRKNRSLRLPYKNIVYRESKNNNEKKINFINTNYGVKLIKK